MTRPPRYARADFNAACQAGVLYCAVIFLIGFCLGTVRVLAIAPRLGETGAVLLEAPVMLALCAVVSQSCIRRFRVRAATAPRLLMGVVAFGLLMSVELGVAVFAFGRSIAGFMDGYRSVAGAIGLAAQIAFAALPVLQGWRKPGQV